MNTLIIFLFYRKWLLKKNSFIVLFVLNCALFVLSYIMQYYAIENSKMVGALKMPLLAQIIFMGQIIVFRKMYKRDPVDSFWTMDVGLMKDGIFNFVFWLIAGILPVILVFTNTI